MGKRRQLFVFLLLFYFIFTLFEFCVQEDYRSEISPFLAFPPFPLQFTAAKVNKQMSRECNCLILPNFLTSDLMLRSLNT